LVVVSQKLHSLLRVVTNQCETLTGLARRFRTSPDVLRQLNRLEQDELKVGQQLRVPKVVAADSLP